LAAIRSLHRSPESFPVVWGSEWNPTVMIGLRHYDVLARSLAADRDPFRP
jgi:hypothetical protein